jgi:hypothetical protein
LLESRKKAEGKIVERHGSFGMTGGIKEQCGAMELDGFIKIRLDALFLESVLKADGKIVESFGPIRMTRRTK